MNSFFDEIVVGAGAVGSATAYHLAKIRKEEKIAGKSLVLEQFALLHSNGSSGGETRGIRTAITQGRSYVPLVKRAQQLWREIEEAKGYPSGTLYNPVGNLYIFSKRKETDSDIEKNYFMKALQVANEYNLPLKKLSEKAIREEYSQFNINPNEVVYREDSAGYLLADRCISAQIELAKTYGATIHTHETMLEFSHLTDGKIKVTTNKAEYITNKLILTVGPWVKTLLKKYSFLFKVHRKVFYWFEIDKAFLDNYAPKNFPPFYWDFDNQDYMYGFPIISDNSIKIATSQSEIIEDPNQPSKHISEEQIAEVYKNYIQPHLRGVTNKCIKTLACLYTMAPKELFIVDYLPGYDEKIILASPCSGRGFKYSSAVGEALAQLAIKGDSDINLIDLSGYALT